MFAFTSSRRFRKLAATGALALAGSAALAGSVARAGTSTVDFSSTSSLKGLGSFKGSATLDGDLLTIQVTNASSKGFLYGLAFDVEGGKAVYEKNDGKHGFKSVAGKHGLLIKPFGKYQDALAVTGANKYAVAPGATRTLLFNVTGEPTTATAFDVLNNPKGESIVAQFKGFRHGARDKAGAAVVLQLNPADNKLPGPSGIDGASGSTTSNITIAPPTVTGTDTKTTGTTTSTGGTGLPKSAGSSGLPGSDPAPAAIPLPPAAWTGLGTLVVLAAARLKRRGLQSFI